MNPFYFKLEVATLRLIYSNLFNNDYGISMQSYCCAVFCGLGHLLVNHSNDIAA
jgi:hypothetical protein